MAYVSGESVMASSDGAEILFSVNVPIRKIARNGPTRQTINVPAMGDTPLTFMSDAVRLAEYARDYWEAPIDVRMISHDGCPCSTVSQARGD